MTEPRQLDVVATVVTSDGATSPFTGARAAFFHVELVEVASGGDEHPLGEVVVGDMVELRAEALAITLVVRRTRMRLAGIRTGGVPLDALARVPPEAVPFLARARGRGIVCFREHGVRQGARLRVRATVDYSASPRVVVRDDLAEVTIDELLDGG